MQLRVLLLPFAFCLLPWSVQAQSAPPTSANITPAADGTGTVVTQQGEQFTIQGGQLSRDGANLFHSFTQVGLAPNQVANFLSQPAIQNIFGRVVGGDASVINGLLQVTGGPSNLYLINPAGIVFGANASLNVPAAFTATTANAIDFGKGAWWNAIATNDYQSLAGNPQSFAFLTNQPGAIFNAGNLTVGQGQSVTLLGGTVVNLGTIAAPGGTVTIAAVPGENLIRISQPGTLLSLDLPKPGTTGLNMANEIAAPKSLPQLLTGGNLDNATGVTVDQGIVKLTSSGTAIATAAGSTTLGGLVSVGDRDSSLGTVTRTPQITVVGSHIALLDATLDASGVQGGGTILIGGNPQGQGTLPKAQFTVANGKTLISADALATGNGGKVIVWADDTTSFSGTITARGADATSGTTRSDGGFVEVSGKNQLTYRGKVDTTAARGTIGTLLLDPADILIQNGTGDGITDGTNTFAGIPSGTPGQVRVGDVAPSIIYESELEQIANTTNVILEASNTITIANLADNELLFRGGIGSGTINFKAGGALTMLDQNDTIKAAGRSITFEAATLTLGSIDTQEGFKGGDITLTATNGAINARNLFTDAQTTAGVPAGNGGTIVLNATTGITTADLSSVSWVRQPGLSAPANASQAGAISLITPNGNITVGEVNAFSRVGELPPPASPQSGSGSAGTGGQVTLAAANGSVSAARIFTYSESAATVGNAGNGGNVDIVGATGINIPGNGILTFSKAQGRGNAGNAGSIKLQTNGNITVNSAGVLDASTIAATGNAGSAGTITLTAGGNITLPLITTVGEAQAGSVINAGAVTLAAGGNLVASDILAYVKGSSVASRGSFVDAGNGGNITLNGNRIAIGNADTSTNGNITDGNTSNGGTLTVIAQTTINAGQINTSATNQNAGGVTLNAAGNIVVQAIKATAGATGRGSTVDVTTAQFFQAVGSFFDPRIAKNFSISTANGALDGFITIRHGGGLSGTPFNIGSSSPNGTIAPISTGADTLSLQSIPGNFTQGNIQILTQTPIIPPPVPPTPPPPVLSSPPVDSEPSIPPTTPQPNVTQADTTLTNKVDRLKLPKATDADAVEIDTIVTSLEDSFSQKFTADSVIPPPTRLRNLDEAQDILRKVESATGIKPAIIYISFVPSLLHIADSSNQQVLPDPKVTPQDSDSLELVIVTSVGNPVRQRVPAAFRSRVMAAARELQEQVIDLRLTQPTGYLRSAQFLYRWMVAPLIPDLKARGIQNLTFILDNGLRTIPMAALHDGQAFLVENYSIGLMPSLSLTNTTLGNIKSTQVLAAGASQFRDLSPLPAVPLELSTITQKLWRGKALLNQEFTLANLKAQRQRLPFGIIHLATHSEFLPGDGSRSHIQLWDSELRLDQLSQLGWDQPPVELVVLSACRTALGDTTAELGFAGFTIRTGVKSALASLWNVSDEGTTGLMNEFYQQLQTAPIKGEALRQAQLAMLQGRVYLQEQHLHWSGGTVALPQEAGLQAGRSLSHPYYWAAFTMIGNPW